MLTQQGPGCSKKHPFQNICISFQTRTTHSWCFMMDKISGFGAPGDRLRARQVGENTISSDISLCVKKPLTAQLGQCWVCVTLCHSLSCLFGGKKGLFSELPAPVKACPQRGFHQALWAQPFPFPVPPAQPSPGSVGTALSIHSVKFVLQKQDEPWIYYNS